MAKQSTGGITFVSQNKPITHSANLGKHDLGYANTSIVTKKENGKVSYEQKENSVSKQLKNAKREGDIQKYGEANVELVEKATGTSPTSPDVEFGAEDQYDKDFLSKEFKRLKNSKIRFKQKSITDSSLENSITAVRFNKNFTNTRKRLEKYAIKSAVYGIGGLPATYLDTTDPPLDGIDDGLGYQYINTVMRYGTFIAFQPGFITWGLKLDGKSWETILNPENVTYLQKKVIAGGIDFNQPKLKEYYLEVARHDRIAILLMGIEELGISAAMFGTDDKASAYGGGLKITKPEIRSLSFNTFQHTDIANLGVGLVDSVIQGVPAIAFSSGSNDEEKQSSGFVVFYVDGAIEASDTISNSAEPSEFKQGLDNLLGDTSSLVKEVMGKTLGAFDGGNSLMTFLGGNAIIPDVWKDTTYQKSYSFNIKLIAASGDPVTVFMSIIHQLNKLMCLAVPLGTGGFYSSAPILRVFSQGVINTEYGLIESMTISRKMETLNDYGMPTEVDVAITLRDLNSYIYREMPGWFESGMTLSSSMTTFLATLCGMNVTTLTRTQKMNVNERMYKEYMANEGTFKNILDRKFQVWADIGENGMYAIQEKSQSIRLGLTRTWDLLSSAPRDIKERARSIPEGAVNAAKGTVNAVKKGLGKR